MKNFLIQFNLHLIFTLISIGFTISCEREKEEKESSTTVLFKLTTHQVLNDRNSCRSDHFSLIQDAAVRAYNAYASLTGISNTCDRGISIRCINSTTYNGAGDRSSCFVGLNFPFNSPSPPVLRFLVSHEIEHLFPGGTSSKYKERCSDAGAMYVTSLQPFDRYGRTIPQCSYPLSNLQLCSTEPFDDCKRTSRAIFWGPAHLGLLRLCLRGDPIVMCSDH
jgi:hypothetical protein